MVRPRLVYLSEGLYFQLMAKAKKEKRSMASMVRDSVAVYLSRMKKADHFSFVGIARGAKPHRTSERADEILRDIIS